MKAQNRNLWFYLSGIFVAFLMFPYMLPGQDLRDTTGLKRRAESQLQKMQSSEIDERIRSFGMTREQAEIRARELGIDLQQYLSVQGTAPGGAVPLDSTLSPIKGETLLGLGQRERMTLSLIPPVLKGFEGRAGADDLFPFGYDIFNYPYETFQPIVNAPAPSSYVLGAGDEIVLTMWGETQLFLQLTVNREGAVTIPNVGPVVANGLTIEKLKAKLLVRLTTVYSGLRQGGADANTWLDVSIGKLRSIQIFVLGEVKKPGGYSVSSMANSLLGLYVAGGPTINGSLREVQVMRDGKVAATVDFYDFILKGDRSKDIRLQDGDVVIVRPVGKRVAINGSIMRPGVYEITKKENLGSIISLAGGLQFFAYTDRVHIERIIPFNDRPNYNKNVLDLDIRIKNVTEFTESKFSLEDGDIVTVFHVGKMYENRVTLTGNVRKPGLFELKDGMTIKDLISKADGVLDDTFWERATIVRILDNRKQSIESINLAKALEGDPAHNILLRVEDSVIVYSQKYFFPQHQVTISGAVRSQGTYPRVENMRVSDILVIAGGLTEEAFGKEIVISRIDTVSNHIFSRIYRIPLTEAYWKNDGEQGSFILQDFDDIFVPLNPKYHPQKFVTVTGEVKFPGRYVIEHDNERVASILSRAGGLKGNAYLEGSRLMRRYGGAGLVPIDVVKALQDTSSIDNIGVFEDDEIIIARNPKVIYVRGEIGVPSAVQYEPGASLEYYLNQAGGLKESADKARIVVILPNGRKWRPGWFVLPDPDILAGSLINVPALVEKEDKTLPILRDTVTILASLAAITVALVQITK